MDCAWLRYGHARGPRLDCALLLVGSFPVGRTRTRAWNNRVRCVSCFRRRCIDQHGLLLGAEVRHRAQAAREAAAVAASSGVGCHRVEQQSSGSPREEMLVESEASIDRAAEEDSTAARRHEPRSAGAHGARVESSLCACHGGQWRKAGVASKPDRIAVESTGGRGTALTKRVSAQPRCSAITAHRCDQCASMALRSPPRSAVHATKHSRGRV